MKTANRNVMHFLLASTSIIGATATSGPAFAQSSDARPVQAAAPTSESHGDIVVTAQRREQRLRDVPISVSVLGGAALEQASIRSLTDVGTRLPNVKLSSGPLTDNLAVRGVGSGQNPGFEQAVATFVDGVYRGRSRALRASLFDIERIEILKGPQTTFFGNNAIAGALNITTKKPSDHFTYDALASFAPMDDDYVLQAGISGPISDTLSIRLAGQASGSDGYVHNDLLGSDGPHQRDLLGRIAIRFEPSSNFRSDLRFDIGRQRSTNAYPFELVGCPPATGAPVGACLNYLNASGGAVDDRLDNRANLFPSFYNYDFHELAWTNSVQIGKFDLVLTTGYFHHDMNSLVQLIPTPLPGVAGTGLLQSNQREKFEQFSQEIRLQSPTGGTVEYMIGAYYSKGDLHVGGGGGFYFAPFGAFVPSDYTAASPIANNLELRQKDSVRSVFGSLTIRPLPRLRLNFAGRYSDVHKSANRVLEFGTAAPTPEFKNFVPGSPQAQAVLLAILGGRAGPFADPRRTDRKFMPSVGFQIDANDDVMAYGTYTRGFKAGGFGSSTIGETFGAETVDAYELGLKSSLFDRRLSLNLALFQSNYSDLQESTSSFQSSGTIITLITNAAKARARGVELGLSARLAPRISLNADFAYLDSIYTKYTNGSCTIVQAQTPGCIQNMSGKRRAFAPEFSGTIGIAASVPVGELELRVDPSVSFSSSFFQSATADNLLKQDAYGKIDLRVGIGPQDRSWEVALIGRNLTDKTTASFRNALPTGGTTIWAFAERPRSVAIQVSIKR